MTPTADFARGRRTTLSRARLGLVVVAGGSLAALLTATLPRTDATLPRPAPSLARTTASPLPDRPALPRTEFGPTFAGAAESLRAGRHAEAYGRFVALADEGDVNAARIALVMHRFGPDVFGSAWDASAEQLVEWTRRSEAAAENEIAHLRSTAGAALPLSSTGPAVTPLRTHALESPVSLRTRDDH